MASPTAWVPSSKPGSVMRRLALFTPPARVMGLQQPLRRLAFPRVRIELAHQVRVRALKVDPKSGEPPPPPELLADVGVRLSGGADAVLVEHDVRLLVVPKRGEDLPRNPEGRP